MRFIPIFIVICFAVGPALCRLPPRNQETDEATPVVENSPPKENAAPVNPVDSPLATNDQSAGSPRKPLVILFRQQPSISLFSNRSPNPFASAFRPTLLDHSHFNNFHSSNFHDDPAVRLISLLMGNRRMRPMQPESTDESNESTSAEASGEESTRDVNPFEGLFPNIFPMSRFPVDDHDHDKEPSSSNEDKTPVNFENKEKKVVEIGGRKFVKTTQVKKVRNDFGQFHSVISSYQPFDEKIHDENGNDKIKPDDSEDNKTSSTVEKKDVESSTPIVNEEKIDIVPLSSTTSTSTSTTPASIEKEEVTSASSDKSATPDDDAAEDKEPEKLVSSTESSSKENEIPDKNTEIKVDQMS